VSILDQNFAPTPNQELAAAPQYLSPVPDFKGNAIVSNLRDLAGAFDKTYVARLNLAAQDKRQGVLDKRYADNIKHRDAQDALDKKHYEAKIARQAKLDEANAQQRTLTNARAQEQLRISRENHSALMQQTKRKADRAATTTKYLTDSSAFGAPAEGQSAYEHGNNAMAAINTLDVNPRQREQIRQKFLSTDDGRAYVQAKADNTAGLSAFRKFHTQWAVTSNAAQDAIATVKDMEAKAPKGGYVPDSIEYKRLQTAIAKQDKLVDTYKTAYAQMQYLADNNPYIRRVTGFTTSAEKAEAKQAEDQTAFVQAHTHYQPGTLSNSDTEAQLAAAIGGAEPGYNAPVGTAADRVAGRGRGATLQLPTAEQAGIAAHDYAGRMGAIDTAGGAVLRALAKKAADFQAEPGFLSGLINGGK